MASDVKKWGSSKRTTALRFLELLKNLSGSFSDAKYLINYPLTNSNSLARKTKPEIMNIGSRCHFSSDVNWSQSHGTSVLSGQTANSTVKTGLLLFFPWLLREI